MADRPDVSIFIQYKGTDICLDFSCPCGGDNHYDGYFARYIKCRKCSTVYELSSEIAVRKCTDREHIYTPPLESIDADEPNPPEELWRDGIYGAIDPTDCGCTDCLIGETVPLNHATPDDIRNCLNGTLGDRTGLTRDYLLLELARLTAKVD